MRGRCSGVWVIGRVLGGIHVKRTSPRSEISIVGKPNVRFGSAFGQNYPKRKQNPNAAGLLKQIFH